jgi:Calcineurin-like phosphoesterase superfamily domain
MSNVRPVEVNLLVFSDIHNNIDAVTALRSQEANEFDAIVIAGDIGGERSADFFRILDTFQCPVLYVYGNWDNELSYENEMSVHGVHLHNRIHACGDYYFAGFSGCPTHWGTNPIYADELAESCKRHDIVLALLADIQKKAAELSVAIEQEFLARRKHLLKRKVTLGQNGHRRELAKLRLWRDRKLSLLLQPEEKLLRTAEYRRYSEDRWSCARRALERNRAQLIDKIKASSIPQDRLILITHERLFRLADDGVVPLLHVFGHRHEYKHTHFAGTNYLNAAALDSSLFVPSEGWSKSAGGYCRVLLWDGHIGIERRLLSSTATSQAAA